MPQAELITTPIDVSVAQIDRVPDLLGDYPGEMRMLTGALDARHVAVTYRRMPARTGGKGGYGHHHLVQEEIVLLLRGQLQVKLGDHVTELQAGQALRIAPEVVRSIWNEGPVDAELYIVSGKIPDPDGDVVIVEDFWPVDD